jgi:hypothetical protein
MMRVIMHMGATVRVQGIWSITLLGACVSCSEQTQVC